MKRSAKDVAPIESTSEVESPQIHVSVLLSETLELLEPHKGGLFIDATLGLGGHAEAILQSSGDVQLLGIDQDAEALAKATERLKVFGERFQSRQANFRNLKEVWQSLGEPPVIGILADLGVSSLQLDSPERGFSFRFDAPLDMRMNQDSGETAYDLLETLEENELADIIYQYGEERFSRRIARRIVEKRANGETPKTTRELAELLEKTVRTKEKIHPATRTFQALRIAVNRELEILESFIETAVDILQPEGRLAVISFHSLEDRIVKHTLRKLAGQPVDAPRIPVKLTKHIEILTRRPMQASENEILRNPRARSAKLRVAKKLKTA